MRPKAIVIGSGIAGIASSIRLANTGYAVEVFEANDYLGGKLTEKRLDAYRFDAGPSLFTMPELVDELFELSGLESKDFFEYQQLDEICRYFYEDGTRLTAFADKKQFLNELEQKIGADTRKVENYLDKSAYIYKHTGELFLKRSLHKISSYLNWSTFVAILNLPFLNIFSSMDRANKRKLGNEKLRQLFNRYATYNGSNPYKAPGILNIIPHLEYNMGAYFPKGGMHNITKSLVQLAKDKGVVFHNSSPVDKILVEQGRAVGIIQNGQALKAEKVICNMDVVPAYKYLMPEQEQPEKILNQERSSSALIFYWGIKDAFPELDLHNIFFSKDYEGEFKAIFNDRSLMDDPTVYVNITSKFSKEDAPKGCENWFVMINVPYNDGQDWDLLIQKARKNILAKLSRMLGRDIESLIEVESILDPRSIESKTKSYKGALYGTSSNSKMAAFFRHPNFSKKIKDLYFCGGSVHPGGGIPLALSSAKIVGDLIAEEHE